MTMCYPLGDEMFVSFCFLGVSMDFGVFNLIVQKQTLYSEVSIVIYH